MNQCVTVCVLSHFSHVRLCDPMDCSPPGSSVHGFSRQEYWSGMPCPPPRDLSDPGIEPASLASSALADGFFITSTTWRPGVLRLMGSQRVGHDWATELNWTELINIYIYTFYSVHFGIECFMLPWSLSPQVPLLPDLCGNNAGLFLYIYIHMCAQCM